MKAIMYHYVRPDNPSLPYFRHLHVSDLSKQLDYFLEKYKLLTRDEFMDAVESGVPKDGVVLTFDDGFKDHYKYVLPELQKRKTWGIFYVPTGPLTKGKLLDVHRVHMLLGANGGKKVYDILKEMITKKMLSHNHIEEFKTMTYITQNNDQYTKLVKRILNYFMSYDYREEILDTLMKKFFGDEKILVKKFYMTPNEVYQMQKTGMVIGSHTVNHPVMSKLTREEQRLEITFSFEFLESVTGGLALRTFCYPYGGFHTFNKETIGILKENGCVFSFNVEARDINNKDLTLMQYALPRYDCNMFPHGSCRVEFKKGNINIRAADAARTRHWSGKNLQT